MSILIVCISLHEQRGGGTAERTRALALHLRALGTACAVMTMEGGVLADELRANGIPVYVTGYIKIRFHLPFINPVALYRAVHHADSVHILGYWNLLAVTASWMARSLHRPYAVSAAGEFAALKKPRMVQRLFHQLLGRGMIDRADSLVAITPLERVQIVDRFGTPRSPVIVIPNGVVMPEPAQPRTLPRRSIVFVGRLAPIKGPDLLLEAFATIATHHPDLNLVLAGPDFGMRAELEDRIAELCLSERVGLPGFVDKGARTELFDRALLLCVPSRAEAMSLIALEAGAAGLAVLLTTECGFEEVEAVGGGAVVPASVAELLEGLERLLADRQELSAMGLRLRDHVGARYAWPRITALFRDHHAMLARVSRSGK